MRPLSSRTAPRMARSASALFGRARSKVASRIGSGVAIMRNAACRIKHAASQCGNKVFGFKSKRSALIRVRLFFARFRYLGFLFRRQMTDDHFAFRRYSDLQIDRDFTMESHRDRVITKSLQRLAQVNAMTIDLVTALLQRFSHIHTGYGAIKVSLLAGFSFELELERAHLRRLRFRTRALLCFL